MVDAHKGKPIHSLRPHHIGCLRFWRESFPERGPGFVRRLDEIRGLLARPDIPIMVSEGVDMLCQECPYCVNGDCRSPQGAEAEVRKWDAVLLRELGVPFGSCLTSGEWRELTERKTPFALCGRCQWRRICNVDKAGS